MTMTTGSAIFTDLDGTLLNSNQQVSDASLDCLHMLGKAGIVRVIATGRSYLSFRRVIPSDFPADYLIFSTGAGILDLANGELLHSHYLNRSDIEQITSTLEHYDTDYMVHEPVPENHCFTFRKTNSANIDFTNRISLYRNYASDFSSSGHYPEQSAQIIAILDDDPSSFQRISKKLNGYQVTRTTSPLDHRSIWMEIYPENVHKGSGAAWLCQHLDIDHRKTTGIGNDYNDIDLLDFTQVSYLLANAPPELHGRYNLVPANDEGGFCHAVRDILKRTSSS
ncbi:HAD family hydrolase [Desulfosediminicola sp.]|uniref:HAD family hydrolase n=1 Tax=Desulfosediminicola sp. TaxID=2886825 RepID=UPI003AF2AE17